MSKKQIPWKGMVDGALFLLLLNQMAYVLTGQPHHERTGTVMVLLVLCHNLLNRRWFGAVGKGKYNPRRLFGTVLNFLTFGLILALFVSGAVMSRYVFDFLPIHGGRALARRVHIACAYWGFLLMAVHIGMHWDGIKRRMGKLFGKAEIEGKRKGLISAVGWAASAYGIYACYRHEILSFLVMKNEFAIFNQQSVFLFVLDYLAIIILIVKVTSCMLVKHNKKTNRLDRTVAKKGNSLDTP